MQIKIFRVIFLLLSAPNTGEDLFSKNQLFQRSVFQNLKFLKDVGVVVILFLNIIKNHVLETVFEKYVFLYF